MDRYRRRRPFVKQKLVFSKLVNLLKSNKKIRELKERIKLLLYNSQHLPIDTQKTIDDNSVKVLVASKSTRGRKKKVIKANV